jgi:hypothetical protein
MSCALTINRSGGLRSSIDAWRVWARLSAAPSEIGAARRLVFGAGSHSNGVTRALCAIALRRGVPLSGGERRRNRGYLLRRQLTIHGGESAASRMTSFRGRKPYPGEFSQRCS